MKILFKRVRDTARIPTRAKENSAGFDMYAPKRVCIPSGQSYWVESGIAMAIPKGYVGKLEARSSHAYRNSVITLGGVIDSDYRGEVKIGLHNLGSKTLEICEGDRVCQMLVVPYLGESVEVDTLPEDTERGTQGFGSTGY